MVSGDSIRVPSPRRYARAYWQGEVGELLVAVGQLEVELSESESGGGAVDVVEILDAVRSALSAYESWIPAVEVRAASIASDGAELLNLQDVRLSDWQLAGLIEGPQFASPVGVEADLSPVDAWHLHLSSETMGLQVDARLSFEAVDGVSLDVSLMQGEETLSVRAVLLRGALMPSEVLLSSDGFSIQPRWFVGLDVLQMESFRVRDLNVSWGEDHYHGSFALTAELPIEAHEPLPLEALLTLSGDGDVLSIEHCELSGAWGRLALSHTLKIDLSERAVLQGAALVASLDLEKQSWIPAKGHLDGVVTLGPDRSDGLDLRFDLNGTHLSYGDYEADGVRLIGEVQGSVITLDRLQLDLLEDTESDRVSISGVADWAERTMDLRYEAALGADWLNALLREEYFVDALRGEGRVFGSFDHPELEGVLEPVTLSHPLLHPVTLAGEVRSLSEGAIDVDLSAKCEGAEVLLGLAVKRSQGVCEVVFDAVEISDPELPTVRLLKPARITYQTEAELGNRLQVEPLHLESEDSAAHVSWGAAEGFSLLIRNMSSTRIDRWLKQDFPHHQVDVFDVLLTQLQPKILGHVEVHAQAEASAGEVLRLDLVSQIETQGLIVEQLAVHFDEQALLSGSLALPLRLQLPHEELPLWVAIPGGHLSGDLMGQTTAEFSQWLAELTNASFEEASLGLSLSGGWTEPQGALDVHVAGLDLGSRFPEVELPSLTDLALAARLGVEPWEVERFECLLNESRVVGTAALPTADVLEAWPEEALDWESLLEHASGRIALTDWRFEDWRHRFSVVMRQSGELSGELVLKPGLDLSGRLVLDDFALRPTSAYSMIDQIGAELVLSDHRISVQRASARVGGSLVTVGGWIDGSALDEPLWELTAVGELRTGTRGDQLGAAQPLGHGAPLQYRGEKECENDGGGCDLFGAADFRVRCDWLCQSRAPLPRGDLL
jgi:hypothetical protein